VNPSVSTLARISRWITAASSEPTRKATTVPTFPRIAPFKDAGSVWKVWFAIVTESLYFALSARIVSKLVTV